jgi:ADP-dependent NAD(P)H-hydrate dehydratase / NAD(P)H-hydrate epimerase
MRWIPVMTYNCARHFSQCRSMTEHATYLYTAEETRNLDRTAIEDGGIPGITLMKRAGQALFARLLERFPGVDKLTVYCGSGNNGGDGYIVAALARSRGLAVQAVAVTPAENLQGDARIAHDFAISEGVPIVAPAESGMPCGGIIVDALLGTGLRGAVRESFARLISAINNTGLPVVSVDIPSGLCADSGAILGCAIRADLTVTFIGRKRGLYTGSAAVCCGEVMFDDLGVPEKVYQAVPASVRLLDAGSLSPLLPPRPADAHKGLYGHVMVIGGELGLGGAASLAAEAAMRVGAGLVSVATRPQHVNAIIARCPEIMAVGVNSGQELEPLLERPTLLVVGPGLGKTPWSEQLLQRSLASGLPMVLDADALNILSEGRVGKAVNLGRAVLTPHPGEAARLLRTTSSSIQQDRFGSAEKLRQQYGATVLLKGAGTLIAGPEEQIAVCPYGNPGMASGGMGDVLSGVIGALLAQGLSPPDAAAYGACLHGLAADIAAEAGGMAGLCATDLMPHLRALRNRAW